MKKHHKLRTRLDQLEQRARPLDGEALTEVTGGMMNTGRRPGGGSSWTWTPPAHADDIYRIDD